MFRPKLDARSYMNLILVVIAALLALNLVAQQPAQSRVGYTPEAEATAQIAASVTQVAQANQQIAAALQDVAKAIGGAGDSISGAIRDSARGSASSYAPSSGSTTGAPAYQGSIEVNQ